MPNLTPSLKKCVLFLTFSVASYAFVGWLFVGELNGNGASGSTAGLSLMIALYGSFLLIAPVQMAWVIWRFLGTRITADSVSQPTLWGLSEVRWAEANRVDLSGSLLTIQGPRGRVVIYVLAYQQPFVVTEYVLSRLRQSGRVPIAAA